MSLKLYYDLMSPPCRALYILLKACKIPFTKQLVHLEKGDNFTLDYQKISPFQKVPAIDHDGFKLIESIAILRYICREFDVPDHWYPKESKSRARVDEYLEWQHHNTRLHCGLYFRVKYLAPVYAKKLPTKETLKLREKYLNETLNYLEYMWLREKNFIAGPTISVADIFCICEVEQVKVTGYDPYKGRRNLASWMDRVISETNPHYNEGHAILHFVMNKVVNKEVIGDYD